MFLRIPCKKTTAFRRSLSTIPYYIWGERILKIPYTYYNIMGDYRRLSKFLGISKHRNTPGTSGGNLLFVFGLDCPDGVYSVDNIQHAAVIPLYAYIAKRINK